MPRALRWFIRGLTALVLLVAVALVTVMLLLRSNWGRERVRQAAQERLRNTFSDEVLLGPITGSVLGRFTIHGFALRAPDGTVVLGAAQVTVDYSWRSLLQHGFRASEVRLVAPLIHVRRDARGGVNLAHLLKPQPTRKKAPWDIQIDHLIVERGTVIFETAGGKSAIPGELWVDASLRLSGGAIAARGALGASGSTIALPGLLSRDGVLTGLVGVNVRAYDLIRYAPQLHWRAGDVNLAAAIVEQGGVWRGALSGTADTAKLAAAFDVTGRTIDTLRGRVQAWGAGTVRGIALASATVDARAGGGIIRADATADAFDGRITAQGALRRAGGAWHLEGGRARGRGLAMGRLSRGKLAGPLDVDVTANGTLSGPGRALAVAGSAASTRLRAGATPVDAAQISFDLAGVASARTTGKVRVSGRGASWNLAGDATLVRTPARTRIGLGTVRLATRDLIWRGQGGTVTVTPRGAVSVQEVALISQAGRIEVTGDLAAAGRKPTGAGKLHVHVLSLDLARVQAALAPGRKPIEGVITADGHLIRRGEDVALDLSLQASRLRLAPRVPAINLDAYAELHGGRLTAGATAVDPVSHGSARLTLDARAPRDPFDARAWRRIDTADVRTARVELREISIAAVTGRPGDGIVDGDVSLVPGGRAVEGKLRVWALSAGPVSRAVAETTFRWGNDLRLDGRVLLDAAPLASIKASVALPLARALQGGVDVRRTPLTADATFTDFPIQRLRRAVKMRQQLSGVLRGDARLEGTIAAPTATAHLRLDGGRLAHVAIQSLALDARLASGVVDAHLRGSEPGGTIDATASAPLRAGPFNLSLTARHFDIGVFGALARDPTSPLAGVDGVLDADLKVAGTRDASGFQARQALGRVDLSKGSFRLDAGTRQVSDVRLRARATADHLVLEELRARSGRGWLRANGQGRLEGLVPASFALSLTSRAIPVNAGRMVVGVDVDAQVEGQRGPDVWRMTANVKHAVVTLPEERATAHLQRTGPLADVVYVDPAGLRKRRRMSTLAAARPTARLRILAPNGVAVRGKEVRAEVKLDLEAVYHGGALALYGDAEVVRGDIDLFGRRYDVQRARASFDGTTPPDPRIDVRLAHEFRTTSVYIMLTGRVRKPELTLRSDPPNFDQAQLLGFVLGGDPDDPAVATRPVQERAVGLASGLLVGQVQKQIEQVLPIDVLRLDVAGDRLAAQKIEIGKWLTDDVYVSYRLHLNPQPQDEGNQNEAALEYRFARRWLLDAYFGDRGAGGADLLWSKRY